MRRRPLFAASGQAIGLALLAGAAAAQVSTDITADTVAGLATGTSITRVGAVTTIDGGVRAGGNLFHSFTTFSLGTGEAAVWTASDPAGVSHVVNRVTGGRLSTIAGTLDTRALPNADFHFINPAGILFTAGARIAIPNAAHFSTGAGGLRFADGTTFAALMPAGASFSSAAPESFGFLGRENGLVIDGVATDFITPATGLFLAAPNIGVRAPGFIPRRFDAVTTGGGAATISLADPLATAPQAGDVLLQDTQIFAAQAGSATPSIRVATGTFTQVGGVLSSAAFFDGDAGDLVIVAAEADISGVISSDTGRANLTGDAGEVRLDVGSLYVHDLGVITSSTFGRGNGGAVRITAGDILLESNASITSDSIGVATTGQGGAISIEADRLTVRDGAIISSSATGLGDAGSIRIRADGLLVDRGIIDSAALDGTGGGGVVSIDARLLEVRNRGSISSSSFSSGAAGAVDVRADRILLRDRGNIASGAFGGGPGGPITIAARTDLVVASDGFIISDTAGPADAGMVSITAGSVLLRDGGLVSSSTNGAGVAGQVAVNAGELNLEGGAQLRSQSNNGATGAAGAVLVKATRVTVIDGSIISSGSFGGDAGRVTVEARDVVVEAGGIVSRVLQPAIGKAGQVTIAATNLSLDFGSLVSSSTNARGDAGDVTVTASSIALNRFSNIESGAGVGSTGNGGTVQVTTDALDLKGTSSIITSTFGAGDAGALRVAARTAQLDAGSNLASRAEAGSTGRAGSIDVTGSVLRLAGDARIATSTAGPGAAGDLRLSVGSILLTGGGGLASSAESATGGRSGSVTVQTDQLAIEAGGLIETNSANPNAAGAISVRSRGPVRITGDGSHISSENQSVRGGAAGSILLSGAPIRLADGGAVSTNAVAGPAGDITLLAPRESLLVLEGRGAPGVITTSSGPGAGGRIVIAAPLAIISDGGRILALGQQRGANVQIQSDFFIRSADRLNQLSVDGSLVLDSQVSDVSAGAQVPDISFLDASGVLRGQCPAARSGGLASQLNLPPFGPYAPETPPPGSGAPASGAAGSCR